MALEFALRPRIKLSEGFAPPRRARFRLPRLLLPIAAYWLTAGGITYALIHAHDQPGSPPPITAATQADESWWPSQPPNAREAEAEPARPSVTPPQPAREHAAVASEPVVDAPPTVDTVDLSDTDVAPNEASSGRVDPHREVLELPFPAEKRRKRRAEQPRADELAEVGAKDPAPRRDTSAPFDPVALPTLAPPVPPESTPLLGAPPPDAPIAVANALPSCEAAAATANQEIDLAQRNQTPDLSREAIASVLDNGVWIARCDIPMTTSVDLCVAIRAGKVIGVSVSSRPASAAINACVRRRAAGLSFPHSSRVDLAHTHF